MSFPYHDTNWTDTASFLQKHVQKNEKILATELYWWLFPTIYRYVNTFSNPHESYDWVILHKGEIHRLQTHTLNQLFSALKPVFANDVFVILSTRKDLPAINRKSEHVQALQINLKKLSKSPITVNNEEHPVLADMNQIVKFDSLTMSEFRQAMNQFITNGGYQYHTLRDQVYYQEIDRQIKDMLDSEDTAPRKIIDIGCGPGRLNNLFKNDSIHGIDISDTAITLAQARFTNEPRFSFQQMDAHQLHFPDHSFDAALFVDAIEHVHDAQQIINEASRVLKNNGLLLITVSNRDSLNQFMTRKLGYPEFVTNYQHIREFSYAESITLLTNAGFKVIKTAGIFLYPYWGIPGIDQVVRELTDHDPETVELMRQLGERVGAEHAYISVLLARKGID